MLQLAVNLTAITLAGVATLYVQRLLYVRRRRAHLHDSRAKPPACRSATAASSGGPATAPAGDRGTAVSRTAADLGLLALALVAATAVAELLGAANMGTALTFGQLAFAATLMWVLLRR